MSMPATTPSTYTGRLPQGALTSEAPGARVVAGPDADGFDTDVLVIGTGPFGIATALALATYGIRVRTVTRWNWVANGPRAHITNQRTLEVLRDLDVEQEALKHATPWELMGDTLFATSLTGDEIARLRTWGTGDDRHGDYVLGSPCPLADIPQPYMEPVLVAAAAERGCIFDFNTEYRGLDQDDDGVTVHLANALDGRTYDLRARYLVGADGARSQVVADLDLPIEGTIARAGTLYTRFRADLSRHVEHRPSILHWFMRPGASFGEIGMGLLRAIRPWDDWIAGWGYDMADGDPDTDPERVTAKIRELIGDPDQDIEIVSCAPWYVNQANVTQWSKGRVFCGGDAVHRHPPSSGLGSNTSIQDGHNLAWKLAYAVRGWAGPDLLDTYDDERRPVGEQIVARANQSRVDYAPLNDCFRTEGEADPIAAGLAKLRDPSPAGVEVRAALTEALELKNHEFNAQGVELNQRYTSTAVVPDPNAAPEEWPCDPELYLQATTRPGAKVPHTWLVDARGRRTSTLDVTGHGQFTLLTGFAGQAWVAAVRKLDLPFLDAVVVGAKGTEDPYRGWDRLREVHDAGAVLVRPDGFVAWRHLDAQWDDDDAQRALEDALHRVLGITEPPTASGAGPS
ncbi:2,4-dichlorophenol 6-monooxygenase [Actinomycetospora succinea]|uniref:2,4-dichlorophenol 6-monooxygenase n=1 Tax=Actinomycetospora succinea TaxID=663603 RepID=A0A4R6VDX5_9PSEU|nr:FAD-dependent monooxygenase [Actinomycetospora succinea]TDQ60952.1 2,4-dichlorophenol 6-monooxygenase [Actinomycetospora succinea]